MGGFAVKNTIMEKIVQTIAPRICIGCGKIYELLCKCCIDDIINEPLMSCWVCNEPSFDGICLEHREPYMHSLWIASKRAGTVQEVINAYKFSGVRLLANQLAYILHERLPVLPYNTVVAPLPSKPRSVRAKGYDHTMLISRSFADMRDLKVESLLKTSNKTTQHLLNKKQRIESVKGIFGVDDNITKNIDSSTPILILDDVVTTGETIKEATRTLARSGFINIYAGAIARQTID